MMRLPYTDSANRRGLLLSLLVLFWLLPLGAQHHHSCPLHGSNLPAFENPLNERWLSAYDVKSYFLELEVSNTSTYIEGQADILVEAQRELDTLVLELQEALEVMQVLYGEDPEKREFPSENELSFSHTGDSLFITLDRMHLAGELCHVRIRYGGEAGQDRGFFAGITTAVDHNYDHQVTYTLSEPHNARDWFPVKQVLEDKIDSVTMVLNCDKRLMAGSNGILRDVSEQEGQKKYAWHTDYPMAYYLLSFAVAEYRDLSFYAPLSQEGDSVLVQNFIYDDKQVLEDWEEDIFMTGEMITAFSRLMTDYPFAKEKYGHCMAPMGGGMEHQTMTTIQSFSFSLVAHELAHQWFGDHITCGNWQDIWINEGFASYLEYIAAQELLGQEAADHWMDNAMGIAMRSTEGSVFVPADEVGDTYRLFDFSLSYKKGAILLHMIRFILDDDPLFFSILRRYLDTYGEGLAIGEDFMSVLEEDSHMDFSCFFKQWYYGEGFPTFRLYWEQLGDSIRVRSEQSSSAPAATPLFQVPFELEIRYIDGTSSRVRLAQNSQSDSFFIPVDGWVSDLTFDPDRHLLAVSSAMEVPSDSSKLIGSSPIRIGPNPFSDHLYIQVPNGPPFKELRITNLAGKEVRRERDLDNPLTLNLGALSDGPYVLELSSPHGNYQERLLKISEN